MRTWLVLVALVGCGRIRFAPLPDLGSDGGPSADARVCTGGFGPWSAPAIISELATPKGQGGPWMSVDRLELIYTEQNAAMTDADIVRATRASTSVPFGPAVPIPPAATTTMIEDDAFVTDDGLTLYFNSGPLPAGSGFHLYRSSRPNRQVEFGTPQFDPDLNSTSSDSTFEIAPDGLMAMFASDRPPETGSSSRLWVTTRATSADPWGAGTQLTALTSTATEFSPTLSPDGTTMLYTSAGFDGSGLNRIIETDRGGTAFANPRVFAPTDSTARDFDPFYGRDGSFLVFASDRDDVVAHLYLIERSCL